MKFSKLSSWYFIISFLGLVAYWVGIIPASIAFRSIGLGVLLYQYWKIQKENSQLLFYLSIVVVAVGEAFIIYGYQHEAIQIPTTAMFIIYYWMTFFLLRETVRDNSIKYNRVNWTIFILVLILIGYLAISFVKMMFQEMQNSLPFIIGSIISFVSLSIYCLFIYFSKRSFRNFWLILLATTILLAQSTIPLEALYFRSIHLKTLGFVAEILGHYFVFQYLITPENEIVLETNDDYL